MTTIAVAWSGPPPSPALRGSLRARGIALTRAPESGTIRVVRTRTGGRTPTAPRDSRWIWWSDAPVPDRRRVEAVLRGAYDVVDGGETGSVQRLAARIGELLTPEPHIPAAETLVTTSVASRRAMAKAAQVARTSMPVLITGAIGPEPHRGFIGVFV